MKATWAQVNGESRDLFKDPVTDNGLKRSARGRLQVREIDGELTLIQGEAERDNLLKPVWRDGDFIEFQTYAEIAKRVGLRVAMPS